MIITPRINKVETYDKNFTRVFNRVLRDKSLSWKARGIFMFIWSLPDNWKFYEHEIATHSNKDGINSLNTGIKELENYGYLKISHKHSKLGKINGSVWTINDKPRLDNSNMDKPNLDNSNIKNQALLTTNNTNHLSKQTTKLINTNNGKPNYRQMIVKDLESLLVNINTFVSQDIDDWLDNYDPKLIMKAIHQVGSTSPSPTWVVKDISTQLARGCQTYQPNHKSHNYYGHKPIKHDLPNWAKDNYHVKLHPTSKKQNEKVQRMLKKLNRKK